MPFQAISLADGSLAIMQTVGEADPGACVAKWPAELRQAVVSRVAVDLADVPADRTFRNAWIHDGKTFGVDMARARDIWRDKLRAARAPLLADLDQAYLRADEAGDVAAKAQVAQQKQALRDAPADPAIDAAVTPEALQMVTLDVIAAAAVSSATGEAAAETAGAGATGQSPSPAVPAEPPV